MDDRVREFILARDGDCCQRCGGSEILHIHHIKSREEGGSNHPHNLVTLCSSCHSKMEPISEGVQRTSLRERGMVDTTIEGTVSQQGLELTESEGDGLLGTKDKERLKQGGLSPHEVQDIHRRLEAEVAAVEDDIRLLMSQAPAKLYTHILERLSGQKILEERVRELEKENGEE